MRAPRPRPGRILIAALLIAIAVKTFVLDAAVVEGRSMLPLLAPGSVVLVLRCAYGLRRVPGAGYLLRWAEPGAGELVAASSPRDGGPVVKRVAYRVPEGFFLLGDNPPESLDSRDYGPVPASALRGRVLLLGGGARHD
ncbi:MAG TPA: S26 family signal peptidase [Spirochaetales bacterium]|nr:S26 family signal peptidase [Spirochaetales bacterium]HRY54225.1 S26 family signal peptidase [Spirochaetia bacterium]HRZ66020.1 S26 family signal peptidase [Spirochaetia bacterium]